MNVPCTFRIYTYIWVWYRVTHFREYDEYIDIVLVKYCTVKLTILDEGDLKVPFSIATTPKCRGG